VRYKHLADGERWRIGTATKLACCDCGLVHQVRFLNRGSELTMIAWRDKLATAVKRRSKRHEFKRSRRCQ
jgi:hypothetical protein